MMKRRRLRRALASCGLLGLAVGLAGPATAREAQRPDIVLFIADDLSREDVGIYGSPDARTPNIDRLAVEGTRFRNAFATSATCTPSRSSIFTGLYPLRHGAHANHSPVNDGVATMPTYLQKLGYRVVIAGKTDIGERPSFPFELLPGSVIHPPGKPRVLWSELGTDAIDRLLATRDRNKPLALIVATFAPHVFWPQNQGYDPAKLTLSPYLYNTPETRLAKARYLTKVSRADAELGKVRASIAKHGNPGNTLFLFTADQGAQLPFAKWNLYDAGIATPLVAVWPGHVPANRSTDAMVSLADLLPTIEEAAGGPPLRQIDGESFLPVLLGRRDVFHDAVFAAHSGDPNGGPNSNRAPMRTIRTDRYKLIVNLRPDIRYVNAISRDRDNGNGDNAYWASWVAKAATDPKAAALVARFHQRPPMELFDIKADPYELTNLAADPRYAGTVKALRGRVDAWMVQQGEQPGHVTMPEDARDGHFPYAQ